MEDTLREYHCYNYKDTPDGQDIGKKIWSITKYAIPAGVLLASWDLVVYSSPPTVPKALARFSYIFFPFVALPVTFVAVTNNLARVRGKDDKLNWVAGGLVMSVIPLVWRKTFGMFFFLACLNTASAALTKYYIQNDMPFISAELRRNNGLWVRQDYTLTRNIPGNYIIKKK